MGRGISSSLLILLMVSQSQGNRHCENNSIDHLINLIQLTISPNKVNVIAKDFDKLSPDANNIVRKIHQNFVSEDIDSDGLTRLQNKLTEANKIDDNALAYNRTSERLSLTVGIIEVKNVTRLMQEMKTMLSFLKIFSPLSRGKYLLLLFSDVEMELKHFFHLAWSNYFLDLTVIQWLLQNKESKTMTEVISAIEPITTVHSFNPFSDSWRKEELISAEPVPIELFPEKTKNFHGLPLTVGELGIPDFFLTLHHPNEEFLFHEIDMALMEILCNSLNRSTKTSNRISTIQPNLESSGEGRIDIYMPFVSRSLRSEEDSGWDVAHNELLVFITIPERVEFYFHLMRQKSYTLSISFASIFTFVGLFYVASVFTIWAHSLGFQRRNFSFLSILTAQMGGSVANEEPMAVSEMIFQMSIYVATFIVVTVGGDYMFTTFIFRQDLHPVEGIKDLINLDMNFIMSNEDYKFFESYSPKYFLLEQIFNRTQPQVPIQGTHTFCTPPSGDSSVLDESVNLCISYSRWKQRIMASDENFQIDKIQDPIISHFLQLLMGNFVTFLKDRLERLIYRFSEVGLLNEWEEKQRHLSHEEPICTKKAKDREVPFKEQLWPIFVVGFTLAFIVLIGEITWKHYVRKTELGKLIKAFYTDTASNDATRTIRVRNSVG
ncbi:hypothetical protein QAD02_011825 [Eretmocerus hayati]|uniref:Uncharacterized protein n=1 Tax=Eretmocerus hayati TaxID=131215 RepID=A0ACC2P0I6_9HYME|nr:hypothetical protein QAD02_011825 [Eretmocerus hayati]